MSFELTILGSNSATPVFNRHQTAQVLKIENEYFLIDCGEGTQMQLQRYHHKLNKINYIFISHLHGDHYLGLVGLISTMHLFGRTKELHIFGPPGLNDIITIQLKYSETVFNYSVKFTELDTERQYEILDLDRLSVETIPLIHRINCCGFLFREKPKKHRVRKELLPEDISLAAIADLKNGRDILNENGEVILKNEEATYPPKKSRSYAYMSDTACSDRFIDLVRNVDLLYHEATFLDELKERAKQTFHSTALEAAEFASRANVGRLIIGHFSSRYRELNPLLEEAQTVFRQSYLAIEGHVFTITDE